MMLRRPIEATTVIGHDQGLQGLFVGFSIYANIPTWTPASSRDFSVGRGNGRHGRAASTSCATGDTSFISMRRKLIRSFADAGANRCPKRPCDIYRSLAYAARPMGFLLGSD